MTKIEIDNKRMWELILQNHPSEQDWINICDIKLALKDQGLCYKNGEITTIEPEVKWYVALDNYGIYESTMSQVPVFYKGERTTKEKVYTYFPNMTDEEFNKHFRPATEEEIPQTNSTKPYNPIKEQRIATDHIESKPEPNKCLFTKDHYTDEERKELCDGCQEECEVSKNIPTFKEVERNGKGELTEFEEKLDEIIFNATNMHFFYRKGITIYAKKVAIKLMDIARKQFLSEYYHNAEHYELSSTLESRYKARFEGYGDEDYKMWAAQDAQVALALARKQIASELESEVDSMVSANGGMCVHYQQGIEDAITKIKK